MRNSEIVTVGELYTRVTGTVPPRGSYAGDCSVCGQYTDAGFHIVKNKVVSKSFGEFALFGSESDILCPHCRCLFSDAYRQTRGVVMALGQSSTLKFIVGNEKAERDPIYMKFSDTLDFLLNPPEGYFMIALNRIDSDRGTHFIPFGVVNYNEGNCTRYYATVWTSPVLIDVNFLRQYVAVAMTAKQKIESREITMLLRNGNKNSDYYNRVKNFTELGVENIISNFAGITLVNKMFSIETKQENTNKGKNKKR